MSALANKPLLNRLVSWKTARLVSTGAVLLLGGRYLYQSWDQFAALSLSPGWLAGSALFICILQACRVRLLMALAEMHGGAVPFWPSLKAVCAATAGNLVLPAQVGSLYLVRELAKRTPLGLVGAGAVQGSSYGGQLLVDVAMVVLGGWWAGLEQPLLLLSYLGALAALTIAALAGRMGWDRALSLLAPGGWPARLLRKILLAMRSGFSRPVIVLGAGQALAIAGAAWCLLRAVEVSLGPGQLLFFSGLRNTSLLLLITPGAIGVSEYVLARSADWLGFAAQQAVLVALGLRIVTLACSMLGVGIAMVALGRPGGRPPA